MLVKTPKRVIGTLAALMLAGCGYGQLPIAPTTNDFGAGPTAVRQQQLPTLPKGVEVMGLSIEPGQASGRVGESIRLTATVKGSDGKNYSEPRLMAWSLSNPQVGVVDQNGVLTASVAGSVKVVASINGISAEATVQVEPARFAWQQMVSPTRANLRAVEMVTRTEAWAAGERGTMLRYLNGAWQVEPSFRQPDATIRSLAFANTNLGWAVGSRANGTMPYVAVWTNNMWTQVKLPVLVGSLNAVSVVSERDVWAVGEQGGQSLILHFDGAKWLEVAAPAEGTLNDVQMMARDRGWIVGKYKGLANMPLIFKYRNGEWVKSSFWQNRDTLDVTSSLELTAIKMVSDNQGYAVGIRDPLLLNPRGVFLSYEPKRDGWIDGQWDSSTKNLNQVPLHDIEMISGTEGWALGETRRPDFQFQSNPQSIFGNLLSNVGGVLKLDTNYFSGNLSGKFNAIDLMPQGDGFVVGENGYILQRTYDWRSLGSVNPNGPTGGTPYGDSSNQAPITYGPGGQTVPGTGVPTVQPTPAPTR